MRCSITCVTVCSSVDDEAPGYVALTVIAGGAIAGYCETGSRNTELPPASMTMIAMTHAKIGRSMKNFATVRASESALGVSGQVADRPAVASPAVWRVWPAPP